VPRLQDVFARATSRVSASGTTVLARIRGDGIGGQFLVGTVLGVVWSPCVGPTLGALALGVGLAVSFAVVGLLIGRVGASLGRPIAMNAHGGRDQYRYERQYARR
jgi:cytochrome c-type biogenesis protein